MVNPRSHLGSHLSTNVPIFVPFYEAGFSRAVVNVLESQGLYFLCTKFNCNNILVQSLFSTCKNSLSEVKILFYTASLVSQNYFIQSSSLSFTEIWPVFLMKEFVGSSI